MPTVRLTTTDAVLAALPALMRHRPEVGDLVTVLIADDGTVVCTARTEASIPQARAGQELGRVLATGRAASAIIVGHGRTTGDPRVTTATEALEVMLGVPVRDVVHVGLGPASGPAAPIPARTRTHPPLATHPATVEMILQGCAPAPSRSGLVGRLAPGTIEPSGYFTEAWETTHDRLQDLEPPLELSPVWHDTAEELERAALMPLDEVEWNSSLLGSLGADAQHDAGWGAAASPVTSSPSGVRSVPSGVSSRVHARSRIHPAGRAAVPRAQRPRLGRWAGGGPVRRWRVAAGRPPARPEATGRNCLSRLPRWICHRPMMPADPPAETRRYP